MANAMVTARMQETKKEAGNRVLKNLDTNASQAINEFYDYLISKKQLPWVHEKDVSSRSTIDQEKLRAILSEMDNMAVKLDPEFADMTIKDAKRHRLIASGLLKGYE